MKKILFATAALCLVSATAQAQVSVTFGDPVPVYAAPAPVYAAPGYIAPAPDWPSYHYDRHRHPHHEYWAHHGPEVHRR